MQFIIRNRRQAEIASPLFVPAGIGSIDETLHTADPEATIPNYTFMKANHSQTEAVNILDVHKSTINSELRRDRRVRGYRYKRAQQLIPEHRVRMPMVLNRPHCDCWNPVE